MNMLWSFAVYNLIPFIALLIAIVATVRIFWALGLRSDRMRQIFDRKVEGTSLRSTMAEVGTVPQDAPESGLTELSRLTEPNRNEVLRILGAADIRFWHRIRRLESWASICRYLTGLLVFVTLVYAASSLQQLVVGLSMEVEHNAAAILDVLNNILRVIFRNTWVIFCLFLLNAIIRARIDGRKERWTVFLNRLTRQAVGE